MPIGGDSSNEDDEIYLNVIPHLKVIYKTLIQPLELRYRYDLFYSPFMSDAEFDSKPHVMLLGQYSVGKTSFIRYLLGKDIPGQRISPEPSTDRFTVVFNGPDERTIPGNALSVSNSMPYRGLEKFGRTFLEKFEGAQLPSKVLKYITLVDTPGVLSGEKQRINRGYSFVDVTGWFARRCDLIFLLFDANKLDISDEFRSVIKSLQGNEDKVRCILNKADQMDCQHLVRTYGALMWSLGRIINTPEVVRIFIGSFWNEPLRFKDNADLFAKEKNDLLRNIGGLTKDSTLRKINELIKRARICRVLAYIISYLRGQMPAFIGHAKRQTQLIANLPSIYKTVAQIHGLNLTDFPDIPEFQAKLRELDFCKFKKLKQEVISGVEKALDKAIPELMQEMRFDCISSRCNSAQTVLTQDD